MRARLTHCLLAIACLGIAAGQSIEPVTRADEIAIQRRAKLQSVSPDLPGKAERIFIRAQEITERFFGTRGGFRPVIGNLVTGAGFAAGVEYFRPDLSKGNVVWRSSARASFRKYELLDTQLTFPRIANGLGFVDLLGAYRNYPTLN